MDIVGYNKSAWDQLVLGKDRWTVPVSSATVENARRGEWEILLTPSKPVPRAWFPELKGKQVLCLASGGGQQGPVLAAAGAEVTVFDNSPRQLAQDRLVAARDALTIRTVEGDMTDLSAFADGSFDLIFHPCSNCFITDVRPVWREAFRVLKAQGMLLAGFVNPLVFATDAQLEDQGIVQLKHTIPYSDLVSLSAQEKEARFAKNEPFVFGHTLEDQIGGQCEAGFALVGFYEDSFEGSPLHGFLDAYVATRAIKR